MNTQHDSGVPASPSGSSLQSSISAAIRNAFVVQIEDGRWTFTEPMPSNNKHNYGTRTTYCATEDEAEELHDYWVNGAKYVVSLIPGFSPMCLAPLDGTPVMLYMPTTTHKFAVGEWHGSSSSLEGNWGDDEGSRYTHEPVAFMALTNLERLVQPSFNPTAEAAEAA